MVVPEQQWRVWSVIISSSVGENETLSNDLGNSPMTVFSWAALLGAGCGDVCEKWSSGKGTWSTR